MNIQPNTFNLTSNIQNSKATLKRSTESIYERFNDKEVHSKRPKLPLNECSDYEDELSSKASVHQAILCENVEISLETVFENLNTHLSKQYPDAHASLLKRKIITLPEFLKTGHPCHFAAMNSDCVFLDMLDKLGADLTQPDANGETPLLVACRAQSSGKTYDTYHKKKISIQECISKLCVKEEDLLQSNLWGENGLELICKNALWEEKSLLLYLEKLPEHHLLSAVNILNYTHYTKSANYLIDRLFESKCNLLQKNLSGQYPLELICKNRQNQYQFIEPKQILDYLKTLDFDQLTHASTLLHIIDSCEILDHLLEKGISPETLNDEKKTPLQKALENDKLEIVEHLITHHANLNAEPLPLHLLARNQASIELFELLVSLNIDIEKTDLAGNNALMVVCETLNPLPRHRENNQYLQKIIYLNFDLLQKNNLGQCPLEKIIEYKLLTKEQLLYLLSEFKNELKLYPQFLHQTREVEIVDFLVAAGIPVDSFDSYGNTPLYLAVDRLDLPTIDLLIIKGADHLKERPNTKGSHLNGYATPQELLNKKIKFYTDYTNLPLNFETLKPYKSKLSKCLSVQKTFNIQTENSLELTVEEEDF